MRVRLDARPLRAGLLLAAVLLVALNPRSAIAAVAPVLPRITGDLALPAAPAPQRP